MFSAGRQEEAVCDGPADAAAGEADTVDAARQGDLCPDRGKRSAWPVAAVGATAQHLPSSADDLTVRGRAGLGWPSDARA